MKPAIGLGLLCALLSGCAGRYVPLYLVSQPDPAQSVEQRLIATMTRLHAEGETLKTTYGQASREADLVQVPLLGAAVAAALVAVNKPANGADTLAKIGIGAGAYSAGTGLALPSGGPDNFRKGVKAINCVLIAGYDFVGSEVSANVMTLRGQLASLDAERGDLEAAVSEDAIVTTEADKKALELARANARLALARAATASDAAHAQLGAYYSAPAEFDRAASEIFSTLAAKTSVHTVIDVSALSASWIKASPEKDGALGTAKATGLGDGGAAALIARLNGSRLALDAKTGKVAALTSSFRFVDRLKDVVKCPAEI